MEEAKSSTMNPQGESSRGSSKENGATKKKHKSLPALFWYMEMGEWDKATERAQQHPREVKTWATLRTKSTADAGTKKVSGTKRLALHHACFKLRSVDSSTNSTTEDDPFIKVCQFILLLLELYPEAAGQRESRHGCLPLHLAAFASCSPKPQNSSLEDTVAPVSLARPGSIRGTSAGTTRAKSLGTGTLMPRPSAISHRTNSESTTDTNMTAVLAEERFAGRQTMNTQPRYPPPQEDSPTMSSPTVSVARKSNVVISSRREEMAVRVLNALLDAYPKGIRVDSEGGRLPLHTACAGRATPRVISTLITAYPAAARHRNKDGFLPLHLAAHWGVSHPNVAVTLLKSYPDATLGRNRWERTPLEEALCMAGENGRPHQAALVRALRKHPSYWTRPPPDPFSNKPKSSIVDMDETVVDDSTSTTSEEDRFGPPKSATSGLASRFSPLSIGKKESEPLSKTQDLATLIKNQNWEAVIDRLDYNPNESTEHLHVTTRGGFIATKGFTPLAYAVERRPPVEVVQALIEASPESVGIKVHPGGALPLHIACTWHASPSVVNALLEAEPAACRVPDELGNVPLHAAAFSGATAPVVDALLRTYPKAALIRNHQGSLPSDICKRLRHENRKLILSLLNSFKEEIITQEHRRSQSSGSQGRMASRAVELNDLEGTPRSRQQLDSQVAEDELQDVGVEVSFEGTEGGMLWI